MNLQAELERVRFYLTDAAKRPTNEANTCDWIIRPLLLQCGYDYHDIHAQGHDAAGNIPDYTILPYSPHTWFLEAKAWQANISDAHINQAANYVNTTAKRWFVVSNGREWRLYDNHIVQVPPPGRLIVVAHLDCGTELENLLAALSKDSIQSGQLERYAIQAGLHLTMQRELVAADSDVVKAMVSVLKRKSGLAAITSDTVAAYFRDKETGFVPTTQTAPIPPAIASSLPATFPATPLHHASTTLTQLQTADASNIGKKPRLLAFPDNTNKMVSSWSEFARGIVEWLFANHKTPQMPFRGRPGGKQWFINTVPVHANGKQMIRYSPVGNRPDAYIDLNRSATDFVQCLIAVCKEVGESPDGFRVELQ